MKGLYKTQDGSKVEVIDFDEANKMVRISTGWVGEPEYSTWEKEGVDETETDFGENVFEYHPVQESEVEQTIVEEQPIVEEPEAETIPEVNENPVEEEIPNPPKKKVTKQPVKKSNKKKGK